MTGEPLMTSKATASIVHRYHHMYSQQMGAATHHCSRPMACRVDQDAIGVHSLRQLMIQHCADAARYTISDFTHYMLAAIHIPVTETSRLR
jgi:hypothetical protein